LQKEDIFKIIDIELAKLYSRIEALGYKVVLSDANAKEYIAEKGWDSAFGARPLKREPSRSTWKIPLRKKSSEPRLKKAMKIYVDFDSENSEITVKAKKVTKEKAGS
jgi:ATP-dependent Clp protease ATP-binding subunit ClpC